MQPGTMSQRVIVCLAGLLILLAVPALAGPMSGVAYQIDTTAADATCCGYGVSANYQYQASAHPQIGNPLSETATTTGGESNTFTTDANTPGLNATSVNANSTWNLHGTTVSATATGAASLAKGELHAAVNSDIGSGNYVSARADVHMRLLDNLTFSIAGAGPATVTNIGVIFQVHGQYALADPGFAEVSATLGLGDASASWDSKQEWCCNGATPLAANVTQQAGGWASASLAGTTAQQMAFSGSYALTGTSDTVKLLADLDLFGENSAILDYADTASIRFILPDNVTFTSDSGVFLSQAVPEPGTLALLIAPAALMLWQRRRPA